MKSMVLVLFSSFFFLQLQAQCVECKSLTEALKDPSKVESLKMTGSMNDISFDEIPAEIGKLVNVKVIYLSDYGFTKIPAEIKNLKKLKVLSFAGNNLTSIPDEIYSLKKLRELILLTNDFSDEEVKKIRARFKKEMPKARLLID